MTLQAGAAQLRIQKGFYMVQETTTTTSYTTAPIHFNLLFFWGGVNAGKRMVSGAKQPTVNTTSDSPPSLSLSLSRSLSLFPSPSLVGSNLPHLC